MTRPYSTGVSPEQHDELMESPEARDARRQAQLAKMPTFIGRVLRGRSRDSYPVISPRIFPKDMLVSLGHRLNRNAAVLRDQFTENIPTLNHPTNYELYVTGGNRHNRRIETNPDERKQALLARQRQTQHVADRLHQDTWREWQMARLFKAGILHVRHSLIEGKEPTEEGLRIAASAVEDLGFCLEGNPAIKRIWGARMIPRGLKQIGQLAASEPRTLLAQDPTLLLLVQREQERREELWSGNLERYEQPDWGGNRRTPDDVADQAQNDALIARLQVE